MLHNRVRWHITKVYLCQSKNKKLNFCNEYSLIYKLLIYPISEVNLNAKKKNGTTTEPPCVTLKINRSFIFAVKHLQNVLYIGRFISPDEEEFSSSRPYMSPSSFV